MSVGGEIDEAFLLVDIVDGAYVEVTLGDLADEFAFLLVVEIDVIVVVALAGPEDIFPVFEVVAVLP